MGEMEIFQDRGMLARAAAERFVSFANHAIRNRDRFLVGLSGDPSLRETYELLATDKFAAKVDWKHVHVFVTDERGTGYDHPESRYRLLRESLLDHVDIPETQCHFIISEAHPASAASTYEARIREIVGYGNRLDLVLLSMEPDGTTASILPGFPGLIDTTRYVSEVMREEEEEPGHVTMTLPFINTARNLMFLVTGADRAAAVKRVEAGEDIPAAQVKPSDGTLVWMIDRTAREGSG